MRLKDKTAIITGSGKGIGRAVALAFVREGAKVVVAEIDSSLCQDTFQEIQKMGGDGLALQVDVSKRSDVEKMFRETMGKFGRVDILVNNAGIIRPAMLLKMTEEEWDAVYNVHLKGTFYCTQEAAKIMKEQGYGKIINVTSSAGIVGTIGQVNYSAAKSGIIGFTKSCARELAQYGINVNAIAPAAATDMTKTIRTDPKFKDLYLQRIPLKRWAEPEEIAHSFVFLASDESNYITGQVLNVDGGSVM